jgi:hypothetical protein
MVHNGIEYGLMAAYAEGMGILKSANVGQADARDRRETTPLRDPGALPVRHQPRGRRGSVAARQRDRVLAPRSDRFGAAQGSRRSRISRAACPTPARDAGRSRPRSTRRCRRRC